MEHLTVRRWAPLAPDAAWERLTDLARLVEGDPTLDLVEADRDDARLVPYATAVVSRRAGRQISTLTIETHVAVPPAHLGLALTVGRSRWLVAVDVAALGAEGGADIEVRAQRDLPEAAWRHPSSRSRRTAGEVTAFLEALVAAVASPQTVLAGA